MIGITAAASLSAVLWPFAAAALVAESAAVGATAGVVITGTLFRSRVATGVNELEDPGKNFINLVHANGRTIVVKKHKHDGLETPYFHIKIKHFHADELRDFVLQGQQQQSQVN